MQKAVFGGGCFWCTEAVFKSLDGVLKVLPGYAGGTTANPTYMQVSSGKTGHAEVIYIEYDPKKISYHDLLVVFFSSHDPTTLNRQGNDVGTQYRSAIFYTTPEQKNEAESVIAEINASHPGGDPVVTEVVPLDNPAKDGASFYEAESYHHDYFAKNESAPYCQLVINPKLEKIQKEFGKLLKHNE